MSGSGVDRNSAVGGWGGELLADGGVGGGGQQLRV